MHFLKIPVFLGWILRILWSKVTNNCGVPEIRVFLGWILKILWSKVTNIYGVPKIHVFLYPETFKFHVVGEFSCWGHELEQMCQILFPSVTGKVQNSREYIHILGNFDVCH